jgi:HAMP domain-containing protein
MTNLFLSFMVLSGVFATIASSAFFISAWIEKDSRKLKILSLIFAIFSVCGMIFREKILLFGPVSSPLWFAKFGGIIFMILAIIIMLCQIFAKRKFTKHIRAALNVTTMIFLALAFISAFARVAGL